MIMTERLPRNREHVVFDHFYYLGDTQSAHGGAKASSVSDQVEKV